MKLRRILFLLLILSLCACSGMENIKKETNLKISEFHEKYNGKKFIEIYDNSSAEFRKRNTYDYFRSYMMNINRKLGSHEKSDPIGTKVLVGNKGTKVTIKLRTKFARGYGVETFLFTKKDDGLLLGSYKLSTKSTMIL